MVEMEESFFVCEICSDPFTDQAALENHRLRHTNNNKCNLCNKALRDEHTLKCHIKTVHAEKTLSCNVCQKKFPHKGVLNAHKKTHSDLTFSCKLCSQTFKNSSYLKKHVRAHSGERPHVCNVCGKGYLQNSHLKVHMSLHTKDKQFQCEICRKTFRLAKSFKEHENMHKNIKNFKCNQCQYSSCFRKNLHAHLKNHQKNRESETKRKIVSTKEKGKKSALVTPSQVVVEPGPEGADSPVYLLVNIEDKDGSLREQIFSIEDIETLDPLEMGGELSITTQPDDEYSDKFECEEYRPLDLTVVPPQIRAQDKHDLKNRTTASFFNENSRTESPVFGEGTSEFSEQPAENFPVFSLRTGEYEPRSRENSPGLNGGRFLDFSVDNSGRRRSVFLAEQLEYEHQGEMRVVDPAEVTG